MLEFIPDGSTITCNNEPGNLADANLFHYKLGLVVIKACHSESCKSFLTSDNAVSWFTDHKNVLDPAYPIGAPLVGPWMSNRPDKAYWDGNIQGSLHMNKILKPGVLGTNKLKMWEYKHPYTKLQSD